MKKVYWQAAAGMVGYLFSDLKLFYDFESYGLAVKQEAHNL